MSDRARQILELLSVGAILSSVQILSGEIGLTLGIAGIAGVAISYQHRQ